MAADAADVAAAAVKTNNIPNKKTGLSYNA
jgi:hypothetical protein